jgi:hypothetical protein
MNKYKFINRNKQIKEILISMMNLYKRIKKKTLINLVKEKENILIKCFSK